MSETVLERILASTRAELQRRSREVLARGAAGASACGAAAGRSSASGAFAAR